MRTDFTELEYALRRRAAAAAPQHEVRGRGRSEADFGVTMTRKWQPQALKSLKTKLRTGPQGSRSLVEKSCIKAHLTLWTH
jgi:hypothetical protein